MSVDRGKLLTVSIAAYNIGEYLADALESCLAIQSGTLEVVVVNDGSSDNSLEVAHGYENRYPNMFKVVDKPNGGYGSTVNAALEIASGKYFRYLDGDDWFDSDVLGAYLDLLSTCDEDVVFTPYSRVYEDGSPTELKDDLSGFSEGSYRIEDLRDAPHIAACALAYRTQLLKDMNFRMSEHCFYTDVEYAYLPFAHVETLRVSKLPLYRYRIGREGQSVSLSGIERHYKDIIRVCARLLGEIGERRATGSDYLYRCLAKECATVYSFVTSIPPTAEREADLRRFDIQLKEYASLYEAVGKRSKKVRLLRITAFLAYGPLCRLSMQRAR